MTATRDQNDIATELAAIRAHLTQNDGQLRAARRQMRATWAVSTLAAIAMFTMGWHKDALAQGYGITLAQAATRIAALETKTASMTTLTDPNTNAATVRFSKVNVQIVSGSGYTNGTINGTGNLIVGYNELRDDGDNRTGSHNLVVGVANNYSSSGGAVIGYTNAISNLEASVVGGQDNTASGVVSCVSGGNQNTASALASSVSGGQFNTASGQFSSVSGGRQSTASGRYSSVSGGEYNTASGLAASVLGGYQNTASSATSSVEASSVSGGALNTASGNQTSISGGVNRSSSIQYGWFAGSQGSVAVSGNFTSP